MTSNDATDTQPAQGGSLVQNLTPILDGMGSLGELIQTRRHALGWTQRQLADRLGVAVKSIGNWETNARQPRGPQLARLGEVLGGTIVHMGDSSDYRLVEHSPGQRREPDPARAVVALPPSLMAQVDDTELEELKAHLIATAYERVRLMKRRD